MSTVLDSPTTYLSFLLDGVCRAIQLTATQHQDAKQKYEAVSRWLAAPGSSLRPFDPQLFPQGSVAIGTTVKPVGRDDHDVDSVVLLRWTFGPMALYGLVCDRLKEHSYYRAILEPKKRCLRLNYEGDIHLDVLPARPRRQPPATGLLVPDQELEDWSPSDPRGFIHWFKAISRRPYDEIRLDVEPLPEIEDADAKTPLQRAVQLLKRRRDIFFDGDQEAARSIVLTTLAAHSYGGERTVIDALSAALAGMAAAITASAGILVVRNPTLPDENFADGWDAHSYARFKRFVRSFRDEVADLQRLSGAEAIRRALRDMFGERPADEAIKRWGKRLERERNAGRLAVGSSIGLVNVAVPGTQRVPQHNFYGGAGSW